MPVETLRMQAEGKVGVSTVDLHAHNMAKWRQRKGVAALSAFNRGKRWEGKRTGGGHHDP